MAVNFEKTLAIVATSANGTDKLKLGDVQINELLNLNGSASNPLIVYGSSIPAAVPVLNGKGGSVTYIKNVLADEITGAAVYDMSGNVAKGEPVTVYLNSHLGYDETLTAAEANAQGLGNWLATKLSTYTPQALKYLVRKGFETLSASAEDVTIAAKGSSETERDYATRILKEISETAGLMTKGTDKEQGIDTFSLDNITVTVSPKIMSNVMAAGLQGDMTSETFANGVVNKMTWAGLKIQSSNLLPKDVDAFIGTSFIGKAPIVPVQMYAGPADTGAFKYISKAAFLLPGTDADATSGFEVIFNDKIATPGSIDFDTDFVTKLNIKLA